LSSALAGAVYFFLFLSYFSLGLLVKQSINYQVFQSNFKYKSTGMYKTAISILLALLSFSGFTQELDVKKWVQEADEKMRGTSSKSIFSMTIERKSWSRTITMKAWSIGNDYSLMYIVLRPPKKKDRYF